MRRLTDTEVSDLLKTETPLNIARREFSTACAMISAEKLSPLDLRRREFEAVAAIGRAFGVIILAPGDTAPKDDPEGHPRWREGDGEKAAWLAGKGEPDPVARSPEERAEALARLPARPGPESAP